MAATSPPTDLATLSELQTGGRAFRFDRFLGQVTATHKREETRVYSTGGGGRIYGYGGVVSGYVNPPTIHSQSITRHEFWLRDDAGRESAYQLYGMDIPMREGQWFSAVNLDTGSQLALLAVVNHATGEAWPLEIPKELRIKRGFKSALIAFAAGFLIGPPVFFLLAALNRMQMGYSFPAALSRAAHDADWSVVPAFVIICGTFVGGLFWLISKPITSSQMRATILARLRRYVDACRR